jgi:hypothetical protein
MNNSTNSNQPEWQIQINELRQEMRQAFNELKSDLAEAYCEYRDDFNDTNNKIETLRDCVLNLKLCLQKTVDILYAEPDKHVCDSCYELAIQKTVDILDAEAVDPDDEIGTQTPKLGLRGTTGKETGLDSPSTDQSERN